MPNIVKACKETMAIIEKPIINKMIINDIATLVEIKPEANGRNFFLGVGDLL